MTEPAVDPWLADAQATARRLTATATFPNTDQSIYGGHCENCDSRWCLPADKATCAHRNICEDCWPNACPDCEHEIETTLRRRDEATNRILSAALELRTGADDLSETDLKSLDWRVRADVLRHTRLAIEAMRRVVDTLEKTGARP